MLDTLRRMDPRHPQHLALGLAALLALAALGESAPPQRPDAAAATHRIGGRLRSDGGRVLEAATLTFHPSPSPRLEVLAQCGLATGEPKPPVLGESSPSGRFNLLVPTHDGALLVLHPGGPNALLGALRLGAQPTTTLICRPLAELTFSKTCDVWIQAVAPDGQAYHLGKRPAVDRLRLPAGEYRFLVREAGGMHEFHRRLESGSRAVASPIPKDLRRVAVHPKELSLVLRDWPEVSLPRTATGVELPRGEGPLRLLARQSIHAGRVLTEVWAGTAETRVAPPAIQLRKLRVLDQGGAAIPGAVVVTAQQSQKGWSLRSVGHTDQDGIGSIPKALDGGWVFTWARGHAACAHRLDEAPPELRLRAGTSLRLSLFDPRGNPVTVGLIEVRPADLVLRSRHRTNHLGQLILHDLAPGRIRLQLLDPRYRQTETPTVLRPDGENRLEIRAELGARLLGRVLLPDGKPASGAVITLTGAEPRTVVAATDGTFQLLGLEESASLRITARLRLGAVSYISGNHIVSPGTTTWVIQLKSEDPRMPGRRKN